MKEKRVDCGQLLSARWGGDQEQRKVHSRSESSGEAPRLIRMPIVISPSRIGLAQSRPASLNFCIDSWPCLQRSSSSLIHHPIFTLLSNDHFPTFTHGIAGLREHLQAAHFPFSIAFSLHLFLLHVAASLPRLFSCRLPLHPPTRLIRPPWARWRTGRDLPSALSRTWRHQAKGKPSTAAASRKMTPAT